MTDTHDWSKQPLKAVPIGTPNLRDVPDALRRLADRLEVGDERPTTHAIVVLVDEHGEIRVYGYGDVGNRANVLRVRVK